MKFALVGTGRMGTAVRDLALARGHTVVAVFNSRKPLDTGGPARLLNGADVVIDFSLPSVVASHLRTYCAWRQPAVVGTTGWTNLLEEIKHQAEEQQASLLCAPNFSLGIQLVLWAIHGLGPLLGALPEYDVGLSESHHTGKADRPSGTALLLAEALIPHLPGRNHTTHVRETARNNALEIASMRLGSIFGEHTITIDSLFDQISLKHTAKNRRGFALGALKAAEWLPGRIGFFTLDDVLADWLGETGTNRK